MADTEMPIFDQLVQQGLDREAAEWERYGAEAVPHTNADGQPIKGFRLYITIVDDDDWCHSASVFTGDSVWYTWSIHEQRWCGPSYMENGRQSCPCPKHEEPVHAPGWTHTPDGEPRFD